MIEALCDRFLENPGLYVDEMTVFLWDEFRVQLTNSSLKRALASVGWSKKVARQEQRNRMRIFEIFICITCRTFSRITWFVWMSLDVINELGLDGQAGLC
jgi:hypothetical protein